MNKPQSTRLFESELEQAERRWQEAYDASAGNAKRSVNRSGIEVKPLYTPQDRAGENFFEDIGFPGEYPNTRGIYASMHRGRSWSQRQLIGWGTPADYNARLRDILAHGATAISLIPCNSVYRGYDADEVPPELLGTCGVVVNSVEDMDIALADVPLERISCAMNDPSPFTLLALLLAVAKRRGIPWSRITGTSNQSDYLSHCVANHMFFRLALPGARRVLTDHIQYANEVLPGWNPLSVVGQHTQQAGATPAEAMGFTLAAALQYGQDCIARGMDPDRFLPRFTFFFDISISFFEEIAKFRAGRRLWARLARERLGAKDPKSWRFKFHGQTSGVDLTRQQPLNNIARVTAQAMAGIFGGLAVAAYGRLRRGGVGADRRGGANCDRHAKHPARRGAANRRDRSARRFVLCRDADRSHAAADRSRDRQDRRGGRHVQGGGRWPGATHDRRIGACASIENRKRRVDGGRSQCLSDGRRCE